MLLAKMSCLAVAASGFECALPPPVDPAGDGLPSARDLFSSRDALLGQAARQRALIEVPTVCYDDMGPLDRDPRWQPFHRLRAVLAEQYPVVHRRARLESVNTLGLLYTVQGSRRDLAPVLLLAHQDVVPAGDNSSWTRGPFSGHFDGSWLWGRGAVDDKGSLGAIMTALETLLASAGAAWQPARTVLVALGFDEECSGPRGAGHMAPVLERRYGRGGVELVLDEGGLGMLRVDDDDGAGRDAGTPAQQVLYALPAVYERGYLDVWFDLATAGGHSSMPPPHTAVGIMAQMVVALEASPLPPDVVRDGPEHRHLQCQARYSPRADAPLTRAIDAGDLRAAARVVAGAAGLARYVVRTAQAVGVIRGGVKINALPEAVTLGVNYRVAVQDGLRKVQHHAAETAARVARSHGIRVRAFEGDAGYRDYVAGLGLGPAPGPDPAPGSVSGPGSGPGDADHNGTLVIRVERSSEPTPVSPAEGAVWDAFAGTIRHTYAFDGGLVVPAAEGMTGNTDTRHYLNLSRNIYRWTPVRLGEFKGLHAVDEGVLMRGHMEMVMFYYNLVRVFGGQRSDVETVS